MSEIRRRRRSEAARNTDAILDAAIRLLGERASTTLDDIASAAGVTRQTVYAHFGTRDGLLSAVADRLTAQTMTLLDEARLDEGPAAEALVRLIQTSWTVFERQPALLEIGSVAVSDAADRQRHEPIHERLARLIARGQAAGEFDDDLDPEWLIAATIALGHVAGAEVHAGRLTIEEAPHTLAHSLRRLYGANEPP